MTKQDQAARIAEITRWCRFWQGNGKRWSALAYVDDLLSALDAAEAELLAARKVVEAARLVNEHAGMALLGGRALDPGRAHELGANKAFNQCAEIVRDLLAAYDAVLNQPPKG